MTMKKGRSKRLLAVLLCTAMMLTSNISTLAEGETTETPATAVSAEIQEPVGAEQPEVMERAVTPDNQGIAVASTLAEEPVATEESVVAEEPVTPATPVEQATPAEPVAPVEQEPIENTVEPAAPEAPTVPEEVASTEEPVEETPAEIQVLEYEDEQIKATVTADAVGVIPEGVTLKVIPITADDQETKEQYEEVGKKLQEKVAEEEKEVAGYLAYDITLIDANGNKVEPNGNVKVSMEYKKAELPKEVAEQDLANVEVTVHHLEEDAVGEVQKVVDMGETGNIEKLQVTEEKKVEKVEINTLSFSCYTVSWKIDKKAYEFEICYVDELGNSLDEKIVGGNVEEVGKDKIIVLSDSRYNVYIPGYEYQKSTVSDSIKNAPNETIIYKLKGERNYEGNVYIQYSTKTIAGRDTWHNLQKPKKIYMVYKNVEAGSGSASGGVSELGHQKYVKLNKDGSYDLTLNVVGGIGTEEKPAEIEIAFVLDTSGSMQYAWGPQNALKIDDAISAAKKLIAKLEVNNKVNPLWKLVTFSSGAEIVTNDWLSSSAMKGVLSQYNKDSCDGGTNYEAALTKTSTVFSSNANTKIVIFLTDGEPTFHGENTKGGGNYTNWADYNGAIAGAKKIKCNQFYAIGMGLPDNIGLNNYGNQKGPKKSGEDLLEELVNNLGKADYKSYQNVKNANLDNIFQGIAGQITKYTASNVTITDTLSDYVDPVLPVNSDTQVQGNPELILKITNESKQDVTETEKQKGNIVPRYDKSKRQIVLDFDNNYELKPDYVYSVTMKVKVNNNAKQQYINNNYNYPGGVVGQHRPGDNTSPKQPGFYSNKEARVTWTSNGTPHSATYDSPVVQIPNDEKPIPMKKEPVNFFLNLSSQILDTEGHVTGQPVDAFTTSVAGDRSEHLKYKELTVVVPNDHNHDQLIGDQAYGVIVGDNNSNAREVDRKIRELGLKAGATGIDNKQYFIVDKAGNPAFPSDEEVFLYMSENWDKVRNGNTIKVNEVEIPKENLNTDNFTIRWTVFKDQNDYWHVDGILVPKSGLLEITKTFPSKEVADSLSDFEIQVKGKFLASTDQKETTISKTLQQADGTTPKIDQYKSGPITYKWNVAVFGDSYQIKEINYRTSEATKWQYSNTKWKYTASKVECNQNGTTTGEDNTRPISIATERTEEDDIPKVQRFEFTNYYNQVVDLNLKKLSTGGDGTSEIDGAVFKLSKKNDNGSYSPVQGKQEIKVTKETTELTNMQNGVYKLEEVKAPEAHMLLNIPIYFKVESGEIQLCKEDGSVDTQVKNMYTLSKADSNNSNLKNTYVLTIKNEILYELPSTGGSGIFWYVIGGTLLMLAAVLLLYRKNRYKRLVK